MAEERLEEIRAHRLRKREELLAAGIPAYPAEARRTHTIAAAHHQFDQLSTETAPVVLVGRLTALRGHGGVTFADLQDSSGAIQLQITREDVSPELYGRLGNTDIGDFIQAAGKLIRTARGVETLLVSEFQPLAKSIRPLPSAWYGMKDHETRFRQREVDLLLNQEARDVLVLRSKVISWLRSYLLQKDFLEVETPILQPIPGGTLAQPFTTHHNALDIDLYLRIAPELYLKRLVVGGFEKVFEIGRNFRNEGIDREHNPEFTMLEFYWAYADYEDLMDVTDGLLQNICVDLLGSKEVSWQEQTLVFTSPLPRQRYIDIVSERVGFDILAQKDPAAYEAVLQQEGIELPAVRTYAKLVDEVYKSLVRPHIIQPTILYDYPIELVPLGKQNLTDVRVAEMFQVVVAGMEIIKAYTELNDPVIQRQRFEEQQAARDAGDSEAQTMDESYLRALEYGMPPTAGYGLGVDRLVAILSNSANLRDTIAFPLLKPE
jgi:lysyl-tRNA synthetase class 2